MEIAKLEDVSFNYGNGEILHNINIRISKGEVLYLIGENGAGKSTLLLILAALYVPSKGKATIFGKEIDEKATKDTELRKKIGIVFQDSDVQLFSPTVFDDVAFAPKHLKEKYNRKMVENAMKRMNVWHLRNRHPYELSEGEKKRASIATVLSYSPEFILLDEPTANMDAKGRREFKNLIEELKNKGKTIVIATHLFSEIAYATRIIGLKNGEIIYDGNPKIVEDTKYMESLGLV